MEPEVHIVEKFFQERKRCLTMTNVRCKGRKEIDLLAIDPKTNEKYHVEVSVHITQSFALKSVDSLNKKKFEDPIIKEIVHQIFGKGAYMKWLVVWNARKSIREASKEKYDIEIKPMKTILTSLFLQPMSMEHPKGSRDDVMRMLELVVRGFELKYRKGR